MPSHIRHNRQSDHDNHNRQRRPSGRGGINSGQPLVAERANDARADAAGVEDQEELPGAEGEVRVVHGDCAGDEAGEAEVHGEGDGPVAYEPNPAGDVGESYFAFAGEF